MRPWFVFTNISCHSFNTILIMNSNSLQINNTVQILKWPSICAPYSDNCIWISYLDICVCDQEWTPFQRCTICNNMPFYSPPRTLQPSILNLSLVSKTQFKIKQPNTCPILPSFSRAKLWYQKWCSPASPGRFYQDLPLTAHIKASFLIRRLFI